MEGCGVALDPVAVRAALEACERILMRPDSPANLARGAFVVSLLALVLIGIVAGLTRLR